MSPPAETGEGGFAAVELGAALAVGKHSPPAGALIYSEPSTGWLGGPRSPAQLVVAFSAGEPSSWLFQRPANGQDPSVPYEQEISTLMLLLGTCESTLERLREAENPVDTELTELLAAMTDRTRSEIERLRVESAEGRKSRDS